MGLETNIFPIINLDALSSEYRLYRIRGLGSEQNEYYQNCAFLKRRLSFFLKSPVTIIERNGQAHLVTRADPDLELPSPFDLVRGRVVFDPVPGISRLDYSLRSPENDEICLRFLQFMIQEPLHRNSQLWQTGAGRPFFYRNPLRTVGGLQQYQGYSVRAVITPQGGLGLAVDVTNRFVSQTPLPARLSHDTFSRWKGKTCIYHYGHQWFEITLEHLSDLNASEYCVVEDKQLVPLLDLVMRESVKPLPPELAQLPHDASVALYRNNRNDERAAPTPLCYPVHDSHDEDAGVEHGATILDPFRRRSLIRDFSHRHLQNLRFGDFCVRVARDSIALPYRMFNVPDFEFGNSQILSVRGTPGAHQVSLDNLGQQRLTLLRDVGAGFYVHDPFDRQYFFVPRSVLDSFGGRLLEDMKRTVNDLYPQERGYEPIIVPFDDRGPHTYVNQGRAILEAAKQHCGKPGYAVVMIHPTKNHGTRKEDQLAAMVVRELRQFDLTAAVMHSAVGRECYEIVRRANVSPSYQVCASKRGKLAGYLRGAALNTVLLTNQRWPFMLATRLHADLTIGIDVKHNTAGLIVVGHNGGGVRTVYKNSRQKEQLLAEQIKTYLIEVVSAEAQTGASLSTIVIHRDGRLYASEKDGANQAMEFLKREGILGPEATLTLLEIPKKSPVSLRLFDVTKQDGRYMTDNPQIGSYYIAGDNEGYVCSTGRAFRRHGTVQPLHLKRVAGPMPIQDCLEDLFFLTTLAWTRPEDCTRNPITTKLNDRFLGEEATEYNRDALEFGLPES